MPVSESLNLSAEVAGEDFAGFKRIDTQQRQTWCISKIKQCRDHMAVLRTVYDLGDFDEDYAQTRTTAIEMQDTDIAETALLEIQEYKARIRALRSLYNSAAPINRILPFELLMEVFSYLRPDFNRRRGLAILRVCRIWTEVIFKTPQFWANLLATHQDATSLPKWKLDRFRIALKHSATLPLSLSFCGLSVVLAGLLRLHAHRIAELHVDMAKSITGPLNFILEADMPALHHLSINPWSRERCSRGELPNCYTRLPKTLPALRSIRMAARHFTASIASSSPLLHVELTWCWCAGCKPAQESEEYKLDLLIRALAQCTALETLRMTMCLPEIEHPNAGELHRHGRGSRTIRATLPRLRLLFIDDKRRPMGALLQRLTFPPSTIFEFDVMGRLKSPSLADIKSLPAISNANHLVLGLHREDRVLETFVNGRRMLRMALDIRDWYSDDYPDDSAFLIECYIKDVAELFASTTSTVTSLTIHGPVDVEPPYAPLAALFRAFPSLTRLALDHDANSLLHGIGSILTPLSEPGTDGRCPCPHLRELSCFWPTGNVWPWSHGGDPAYAMADYSHEGYLDALPDMRDSEESEMHTEIADSDEDALLPYEQTWVPYGAAETHAFLADLIPPLTRRVALGAAPLKELCIGITRGEALTASLPRNPLDQRLAQELKGLVDSVSIIQVGAPEQ
ncbi:hypothetical protein L226DRAFT_609996 [Lentinus tigrinus ALCF2SS1-7]|uniref:F-box domain-containing protein n=1 Tax=Lentinus tigrinus ALCF2SS1-6 TaxID=1328759 RepID=A0A5C2RZL4_9APHY|nr:hypothetical protein L227DRAFT_253218 [Lentinus tigrinus ALCF2SS1-6]RPD79590.1 hypothetical protein L226DRAFT_609996 [Lentinus tigrinus ALCF2SS1-7]